MQNKETEANLVIKEKFPEEKIKELAHEIFNLVKDDQLTLKPKSTADLAEEIKKRIIDREIKNI